MSPVLVRAPARFDLDAAFGDDAPDALTLAAAVYLLLPSLLFLAGWARAGVAMPALAAGCGALAWAPGWRRGWPLGGKGIALCLMLGLLWAGGSGMHHLLYSAADWQIRDAVLRDLASLPWPVAYRVAGEAPELLRAPLGYFLPATLAGPVLAPLALWAWTGIGLGLVLALLARLAHRLRPDRPWWAFAVLAAVFALFHGLDLLPNMALDWRAGIGPFGGWQRGGEWWDRWFQYPGAVTSLLWAPNHALPPWLLALLLLRHGRHPAWPRGIALPLAAGAFWSPLGTAGAAVLALVGLGWRGAGLALRAPGNWLALPLALPICLYLLAGAGEVPHGLLPLEHPWPAALARWGLFLAVELLPWALPLALLLRGRHLFAAVSLLVVLPLYVFGPGNEMASRGSLAALAVLAVAVGAALLRGPPGWPRRVLAACCALALGGAVLEASLLTRRPWRASTACTVPEAARQSVFRGSTDWSHYFAPWPEPALQAWLRPPVVQAVPAPGHSLPCWPERGP